MDIMELGAIGELVGGVAVIATLIYLARQISHSVRLARTSQDQLLMASYADLNALITTNAETRALLVRMQDAECDLSSDETVMARHLTYRLCNIYNSAQAAFENRQIGDADLDFYDHDLRVWTRLYPGLKSQMIGVFEDYPDSLEWKVYRSLH